MTHGDADHFKGLVEIHESETNKEKIARLKKEYYDAGQPVASIDTKKKEILGRFFRGGAADAVEPAIVNDHDFVSSSEV